MTISTQIEGNQLVWQLDTVFEYSVRNDFDRLLAATLARTDFNDVVVDFSRVRYLDSVGIGMLLELQEQLDLAGKGSVTLRGARGMIRQILAVAHLERKFKLE